MRIHWSDSEEKVVAPLRDYQWHCIYNEVQMKDDRARLTSIRRKLATIGYGVESRPCTIHSHESRILMRRIIKLQPQTPKIPAPTTFQEENKQRLDFFDDYVRV